VLDDSRTFTSKSLTLLTNLTNIISRQKLQKIKNMVAIISQIEDQEKTSIDIRADDLIRETKVLTIARLAKMLVDLFGLDGPFEKVGKHNGQEIEMYFAELDGYITFILTSERGNFDCVAEKATNPIARLIITVEEEKILGVISSMIRSKNNIFSLIRLMKYIIPGKAKIKGSYVAAIKLIRCLMIGKHEVYSYKGGSFA